MPSNPGDYQAVRADIKAIVKNPSYDDGSIAPVLVRLAWHASGTYDKTTCTGGSDGATMRFEIESKDPANAGLVHARDFLLPVKEKHPWITHADLWTLAGVVGIEAMGGPIVPWRPGRLDKNDHTSCPPNGRLPDASQGEKHIREVFNRMGFEDREIVALMGAHTVGRCHTDRSGYDGPWTHTPTRFTNQFFKLLLKEKWNPKEWTGPKQFSDGSGNGLMMLPTDMAMLEDPSFRKYVELYAEDKDAFFKDFATAFGKLLDLGVKRRTSQI